MKLNIPPAVRTRIYAAAVAAIPILAAAGAIAADKATAWLNLAAALLGLGSSGVALAHRPTKPAK